MNAYLIDPAARTISVVNTDFSLQSIYNLLGCKLISTAAGQTNGDLMFIDDDVTEDEHEAFRFGVWEIYSKALVVGTDEEGDSTSPKTPIEKFDAQVCWLGPKMFEPNVAVLPFPADAFEDWLTTSTNENLAWWDAFLIRNELQ